MKKSKKKPELSIIITTCNRFKDLITCLKSIKNSTEKKFNIVIIDDNSNDETKYLNNNKLKKILKIKNQIRIIHSDKQLMMVRARNLGAKIAKTKYILFIDDDNIIEKNMVKILLNFIKIYNDVGMVGPFMYYGTGELYMSYQKFNFYTGKTTGVIIKNNGKDYYESDGIPNVFLIKKEIFEKIGYFDEKILQTFTEMDFGFKIKKAGYRCCMLKDARTYHNVYYKDNFTSRGLGGKYIQKSYCLIRNRTIIIKRYGNLFNKIIYLIFFSWFWPLIYSIIILFNGNFYLIKYYWLGYIDGIISFFSKDIVNNFNLTNEQK